MQTKPQDHRALLAANAQIALITWIQNHPGEPVPAQTVRDSMNANFDFFADKLIARLEYGSFSEKHDIEESIAEKHEPDRTFDTGT